MKKHEYSVHIEWTGNEGKGTLNYKSYNRNHNISVENKYDSILGSADPSFMGDANRYNPEELFLSSLSSCHMLWYLHLCSVHHITVVDYKDSATGVMEETKNGSGRFVSVQLNPVVSIEQKELVDKAKALPKEANKMCFIANSCNFEIDHGAVIIVR